MKLLLSVLDEGSFAPNHGLVTKSPRLITSAAGGMATQVLSPARGVMVTVFAMMLTWLDVVGYFQSVCWLCGRVGVIKALAFSMVLRFHFLPPWDDASQTMKWAATDTDEFYLFEPTLEQMSPTLNHGFLFIPGALVHPHSYAPVLSRLANASKGQVLCVCVKPRFRHPALWADSEERALTIISEMMRRYPSVTSWTIGGHSMGAGGYGAARIVSRLLARGAPVRGLVMWAGAITNGTGVDLKAAQLRSLVLLASEDSVVPPHGKVEDGSNRTTFVGTTRPAPRSSSSRRQPRRIRELWPDVPHLVTLGPFRSKSNGRKRSTTRRAFYATSSCVRVGGSQAEAAREGCLYDLVHSTKYTCMHMRSPWVRESRNGVRYESCNLLAGGVRRLGAGQGRCACARDRLV